MTAHLALVGARSIIALPVVTIDGGEDAAEIKDVIYDATAHRLIGFTLNKRGWLSGTLRSWLPADNVIGIGPDAVMIADERCITDAAGRNEHAAGFDVMGIEVVTADGTVLGTVVDVIVETAANPAAVGYEVSTPNGSVFVPSSSQMALSGNALIVPPEADPFVTNDLAGFGAAVTSFRSMLEGRS
jgi:uncharacterized protein YrrD